MKKNQGPRKFLGWFLERRKSENERFFRKRNEYAS